MPSSDRVRHSVCALDCPDTCAVLVQVDEDGRATKLKGDPSHPITRGFLCSKVTRYLERQYHPDRLRHPMRRTGAKGEGRFERMTWDEALDEIAAKLKGIAAQFGPEAVLPYSYAGTMGLLNGSGMDRRFFHRLGASRLDRTICASTGAAALLASQGARFGTEPEQFAESKLIIAWGANILGTNPHLWPFITEARRNGAKFYVIDPVRNRTGQAADRLYQVNPGSDVVLALAMIHVIFRDKLEDREYIDRHTNGIADLRALAQNCTPEFASQRTGLSALDIEQLAREYAQTKPAAIRLNYGVQRSENGGSAVRAISALPVITGSWRVAGGGLQLTTSGAFEFDRNALERPDLGPRARTVNMIRLGEALTALADPPVKGLVVYNSNPAAVAPNQSLVLKGMKREDLFTVVLEQFQTDTADYADIMLPATTFLEHTDLYLAYGHYYVQMARPALEREGEARSNVEVFRALAKRMGFQDSCFDDSEEDMIRSALGTSPFLEGVTLERLQQERFVRLHTGGKPYLPFADGAFRTASARFEFGAERWNCDPPIESRHGEATLRARYPLEFVSPKADEAMNSTFGHRDSVDQATSVLRVNPVDANGRGLRDNNLVRLFNDRGSATFVMRITQDVRPGVVSARSTRWNKRSAQGLGINQLTSDRTADLGGGPVFYSCLVEMASASSD